jgi:hypothetical protein
MGLYINQQNSRTKLQEKVAAELRAKAAQVQSVEGEMPDGVEDSAYLRGTRQSGSFSRKWFLFILLVVALVVLFATAK